VAVNYYRSHRLRIIPVTHFQNDGATVEYTALVLLQIQLSILCFRVEMGWKERKWETDRGGVVIKTCPGRILPGMCGLPHPDLHRRCGQSRRTFAEPLWSHCDVDVSSL